MFNFQRLGIILLMGIISALLWNTPVLYPFRIFVVFIHESSHALASILTGGKVLQLSVSPDESGFVRQIGGNSLLTASAGYIGSSVFGGLVLVFSEKKKNARYVFFILAVLVGFMTIAYVRNLFGITFGLLATAGFWFLYSRDFSFSSYFLDFIGVTSSLYAIYDLTDFLIFDARTDAVILSEITFIPATIWALLWSVISILVLFYSLRKTIFRSQ
ncbi:MAG: M50 family peptidase [Calditrichaeota bacterium]|nr:MAG: M50 family peptidase [Calditrichota bacterium]